MSADRIAAMRAADAVIRPRYVRPGDDYYEVVGSGGVLAQPKTREDAIAYCQGCGLSYYVDEVQP